VSGDVAFVQHLVSAAPVLAPIYEEHLRDNFNELLPHVFFGDVTRFVISGFSDRPARRKDAEKILALLEQAMASPTEEVLNVLSVSFCENLLGEGPLDAIRATLGPKLRAELAYYEQPRVNQEAIGATGSASIRSGIRDLLALLATPDRQREYERNVPIANVPAELLCMWFDDQYHPSDPMFRAAFSSQELEALASFDTAYGSVSDEIRPLPANVAALQAHSAWQRAVHAASIAFESIAPTRS
jgi:hypothetical protein